MMVIMLENDLILESMPSFWVAVLIGLVRYALDNSTSDFSRIIYQLDHRIGI